MRAAAKEFNITHTMVIKWKQGIESLLKLPKTKKACRGPAAAFPELEMELLQWIEDQRSSGNIVTKLDILLYALKRKADPGFKASETCVRKFMKRNGLCLETEDQDFTEAASRLG